MSDPVKIVSKNFGVERGWELDVYESRGGYQDRASYPSA